MPVYGEFTEDQALLVFEILDTPFSTQYTVLDGMGLIGSETDISNGSSGQASTMILAWLTAMDAATAARAIALTVDWVPLRKTTATVHNGGVGEGAVTGVDYDPTMQRKQIQTLMQIYVPFYRLHEVLARRAGTQNSMSIATVW